MNVLSSLFTIPTLSPLDALVLFLTAMLAGMFNAIAGGGSFLVFPMLLVLGIPAIAANATSTIGLLFGVLTSAYAYRKHLIDESTSGFTRQDFWGLTIASFIGGIIGSLLLLQLPAKIFTGLVPYLMLMAAALFTLNPTITRWLQSRGNHLRLPFVAAVGLQLIIAIYGGYFGGGASILMLAVMNFMGLHNLNAMNGMKSWLGAVFNSIAIFLFIQAGKIIWLPGLIIAAGSIFGALISATIAQKIPQKVLRFCIVAIAWAMTVYLFWRSWQ
ncbi:sulfite exporter TauE/SafE family protein [Romeriopsis navalis]|uniref:sulfite exporter TauE/SafE family protein n=1 Tax=Romeriopsis navalis TaxID=2992132 RepID=UPI0021F8778C|nr:sulfite exporter TauE/SafE family protein [Romeriopsis navalis]